MTAWIEQQHHDITPVATLPRPRNWRTRNAWSAGACAARTAASAGTLGSVLEVA
jgi:hypothetical protein